MRIVGVDQVPPTPFAARRRAAQAGADADPDPHPHGQARAGRARHGRGGDLVVHLQARRPNCSAAASPNWRSPIRSRPNSPTCGRACCRAWSPRRSAMPIAASPTSRCSRSARSSRATGRRTSSSPPPACAARLAKPERQRPPLVGSGKAGRCVRRQGRCARGAGRRRRADRRRCRSCPAARPGCIPAAPARSRSGRRTCSAISANCIRARSRRSKADGPLVGFEVILDSIPEPKAKADARQAAARTVGVPAGRRATSPSSSTAASKAADIVRAAQSVDKKLITGVSVFDVYEGKGIEPGKKSIAIAVTTAAAREDDDRPGDRRGRPARSSPKSPSGPAARCELKRATNPHRQTRPAPPSRRR